MIAKDKILSAVRGIATAAVVVIAAGCGGSSGSGGQSAGGSCTVLEQNQIILEIMQDIYLWNDRLPTVDPADFSSPEAYLQALLVPEDEFSFITSAAADDAFFGDSQFAGIGFQSRQPGDGTVRVVDVFEGSPADRGGLARGDSIVAVEGRPIEEILAEEGFSASLGPPTVGTTVRLDWIDVTGQAFSAVFTKEIVTIPPVSAASVIDTATGKTGYFLFRNFVEPGVPALNQVFADLIDAGIDELVIDLRYNSGGLLSVLEVLANLIGGEITQSQIMYSLVYNDDNAFRNETRFFSNVTNAADLTRVVIITTGSTASASEMVINALRPFIEVVLIGDTTFGKPVGQLGFVFCEKILRPVSFRTVNAVGDSDFFDGFAPDCVAEDDIDTALGDPAETSLSEALAYLQTGSCSVAGKSAASAARAPKPTRVGRPRWRPFRAN
jgi:C-terminal peptidase prc